MEPRESDDERAVRLLNEQLKELESIRLGLSYKDPLFKAWRDKTKDYLKKSLPPDSSYLVGFENLYFASRVARKQRWGSPPRPPGYVSPQDQQHFMTDCRTAEATIKAALKYIEEFGVHSEQQHSAKPAAYQRGVQQNFYGNVTIQNQAIATDNATQNIGQLGDTMAMGASLEEIAGLFEQSEDLTKRDVKEGLAGIEVLTTEIQKPEQQRNWKSMLDYGQLVLTLADKTMDLAHKLAPYKSAVVALVQSARLKLGM
jgi:hypothetical protein